MPSIQSVANRRLEAISRVAKLPGTAVEGNDALSNGTGLSNAAGRSDQLSLLTAQSELLELFCRVVESLVARLDALAAVVNETKSPKGKK